MKECPNCGKKLEDNANFCSGCQHDLTEKTSNKGISTKLLVVVIVAVIAIVGVALASGMFSSDNSSSSDVSSSQNEHPNLANNDSSSGSGIYWASKKAEKFHLPECEWAQKISENNKIVYNSREDAISDGKIPCDACNP